MAIINRPDIQKQIDIILKDNPTIDLKSLKSQLSDWLGKEQDIPDEKAGKDFIREHIVSDIEDYIGVPKE